MSVSTATEMESLPFASPCLDEDDIQAVIDVLRSGWITTGPKVREFEAAFAERLGVRHAIAVNSATAALHLGLDALGITRGAEVIVPTTTFTATAEVVRYFDATPVFVDVLPRTGCMDPDAVERAITERTRVIIPVHLAGHPCDMDALLGIARAYKLGVVEDAAHAFPCRYRGQDVGTQGDLGAFSFYATKTITTGEGGMVVTDDDALAERVRIMALHGMSRDAWKRYTREGSWRYDVVAPGYKYNMTDIAAALGLSQLRKADWMWRRRQSIAGAYSAAFGTSDALEVPVAEPSVEHAWHLYILRLNLQRLSIDRDQFMQALSSRGVQTSVHFIPVHTFTYYRETYGYRNADFPVAMREFSRSLSLPIYPAMSDADVALVIRTVEALCNENSA